MIGSPLYVATLCNNDITQEHEIVIRSYARWKELIGVKIQKEKSIEMLSNNPITPSPLVEDPELVAGT
ncbi:MAG: hypothetical protein WBF55_14830, partial [Syntrophobacteria bacterium]